MQEVREKIAELYALYHKQADLMVQLDTAMILKAWKPDLFKDGSVSIGCRGPVETRRGGTWNKAGSVVKVLPRQITINFKSAVGEELLTCTGDEVPPFILSLIVPEELIKRVRLPEKEKK